jgi:hypothetical protein
LHRCEAEQTYQNQERYVLSQGRGTPKQRREWSTNFFSTRTYVYSEIKT